LLGIGNTDVFSVSHDLFHAYQQQMEVNTYSIKAETESYLYCFSLASVIGGAPVLEPPSFTKESDWVRDFKNTIKNFDEAMFWGNLVYRFQSSSPFNKNGIYDKLPWGDGERVIIDKVLNGGRTK